MWTGEDGSGLGSKQNKKACLKSSLCALGTKITFLSSTTRIHHMHIKQLEKVKQSVVTVIGHRLDCELENPFLLEIRNGQVLFLLAFNIDTILRSTSVLKNIQDLPNRFPSQINSHRAIMIVVTYFFTLSHTL